MVKIAICLCGFNRNSLLTINLKNIFEKFHFYNNKIDILDAYYHTWETISENNLELINIDKIKKSFIENGIDNIHIKVEKNNIEYFLKLLKLNNIKIENDDYLKPYPMKNRFLSCLYSWSSTYKLINKEYDYIYHLRLDWGLEKSIWKIFDINNINKNTIVGEHISGNKKIDPRFIFGNFKNMINFKYLFYKFFKYDLNINNRDHIFLRTFIIDELKCNVIPVISMIDNNKSLGKPNWNIIQTKDYNNNIINIYSNFKYIAISLRGKCKDSTINTKTNKIENIDYKNCIKSIIQNILNVNNNYIFDFYLHGWISENIYIHEILNDYKPENNILELQKNFYEDYKNIKNYKNILIERYKHLDNDKNYDKYNDINYLNYFQGIHSYAYSISKSIEIINNIYNYDYIINLRYDCYIDKPIIIDNLDPNLFYTDDVKLSHSPLFYGDFLFISKPEYMYCFKNFYSFLKTKIYNDNEYINWTNTIISNKNKYLNGRFEHGIYSNQIIIAYFLYKNNIDFCKVKSYIKCHLKKS